MKKAIFPVIGLLIFLCSCRSTQDICGKYVSNFAVSGFFVTRLQLNTDSTFTYRMSGDLMYDTSSGHYKLEHKYVVLSHKPFQLDSVEYKKYGKDADMMSKALAPGKYLGTPERFLIGHNKLFGIDNEGNVVKRRFGYSKRKQYLFFGQHGYKRRYYLKRVNIKS